ncbi:MAG TPA: bifunctional pyr operon transcriptional regulator/uracil phosphoribosyltransferase PyrR [Candidatus Hydrogenedentes bacterium]|nr:bifunctional pyr operon transcriptional regulator/uracil phosphoribosyltransferase PyrR [Candidatus Hydrogenedentota bacterium]HOC72058.1 bifunctional pyr operon transcriptional regulator/uracil phosphoribosyltransferase PyrR [Candidatus Hydrogenedentota bacterium]HOH50769.1 bifunctional pyr operon transcriptional regulator/uracil phosphoribosyltransferase PyrR [Candidatus Hydrogenedentota bacterium]HPA40507.1 bifunctional pyr operon transcriptional regulator/uracil phosphoribosyltransferase 
MTPDKDMLAESTVLMDRDAIAATVRSLALAISDANPDIGALVLLGILRRGRPLADRLAALIGEYTGTTPPVGSLATTMYRDDVRTGAAVPQMKGETHFDFSVDDRTVLLVDDVLAAGRTIRAALDEVMDYGRPRRIQLACLVDRGGRELPIQADYLGYSIATGADEWVSVRLRETDDEDAVLLLREDRRAETND